MITANNFSQKYYSWSIADIKLRIREAALNVKFTHCEPMKNNSEKSKMLLCKYLIWICSIQNLFNYIN